MLDNETRQNNCTLGVIWSACSLQFSSCAVNELLRQPAPSRLAHGAPTEPN